MTQLAKAQAVRHMQEYIEENLAEQITLFALAREAGYSPWHSAKMFHEYTGLSPFEYIRRLRLSKAALVLRDEKRKVLDVALDFVFDSHEGFTRAFRKEFGITPKSYQSQTPPIPLFTPYPADGMLNLEQSREDLPPLSTHYHKEFLNFPARKMILKRGISADNYFDYVNEIGCDVWGILVSIKQALYEPVGMWLSAGLRPEGTSVYAQGVEVSVDYQGLVPEGFDVIDLPACTMMMFQSDPYEEERFDEAIYNLSSIIDDYDPSVDGFSWSDCAPRIQLEPQGYRGYIEALAVKEMET
ncbi:MAG: AraC family transcriptional regulator [Erysipelotrichaceae bacterium]|jgi:AraC-like DNA-binding protein|nr:AraC family transcriptional regulator [Erysipelotrichaceae bacterium]